MLPSFTALLLGATLAIAPALAQQAAAPAPAPAPAPPPSPVKLALDVGFVNSAGNTQVTTLTTGQHVEFKAGRGAFIEDGNAVYGRIGDSTTAEQIKVLGKVDYQLVSILHGYAGVSYERNRFSGVDHRFQEILGLALRILDLPKDLQNSQGRLVNSETTLVAPLAGTLALKMAYVVKYDRLAPTRGFKTTDRVFSTGLQITF